MALGAEPVLAGNLHGSTEAVFYSNMFFLICYFYWLFDFSVGVIRWSWRVSFTVMRRCVPTGIRRSLCDLADYPARLDLA